MRSYFMQTERMGFSIWRTQDITYAKKLWGNRDVTRFICATGVFSPQDIQSRLEKEIATQNEHSVSYWPVFLLDSGNFAGCCGLRPYRTEGAVYELGFHLRPNYWGKGLGEESARAVVDYALTTLNARDLFAGHHPENKGSASLLKKLGFHKTHDEFYEPTGLMHPSYRYKP